MAESKPPSTVGDPPGQAGYASRGALKLLAALNSFHLNVTGWVCADFGASTGGFTDCLLRAGAAKVYAIDTAYGQLAWKLRNDSRVVVMERTNALRAVSPEPCDLVVADMGWTPQRLLIPAAMAWLRPGGRIVTLIKPHYELKDRGGALPPGGVLDETEAGRVVDETVALIRGLGANVVSVVKSPIRGGAGKSGSAKGNVEWLALVAPGSAAASSGA